MNSLSPVMQPLANEGLAHTSIKCYMSAVRHLQIEEGWGDPKLNCMSKLELELVMRGIKRVQGSKHKPSPRQPITPELLRKLREVWLRPSVGGAMASCYGQRPHYVSLASCGRGKSLSPRTQSLTTQPTSLLET